MIRDEELARLVKYAQGMGVSVRFKPRKDPSTAADWSIDGSEICVYVTSRCSKIDKIMSLIHEIAHHKAFINNERTFDPKVEEALDSEKNGIRHRKRILDMEINDSKHWEQIYKDTNCQFPMGRLEKQRELDIWCYQLHYETGSFPTGKEKTEKKRELRKKYGF